jgi:hypothetical protein
VSASGRRQAVNRPPRSDVKAGRVARHMPAARRIGYKSMTTSTLDGRDLFSVLGAHGIEKQLRIRRCSAADAIPWRPNAGGSTMANSAMV